MRTGSFLSLNPHGFHRIAFTDWGDSDNDEALMCVHGLTRNGRDFDFLAAALAQDHRVVCPDVVGRGCSDWLDVKEDYSYTTYCTDTAALMAWLRVEHVDWVGTSMGGLIGMLLAAQPQSPIRRLVLNDVGPFIPKSALERIAGYVGTDPRFDGLAQVEAYLREVTGGFGPLNDEQWDHLVRYSVREMADGQYALMYDPAIALAFRPAARDDIDLWAVWDKVQCPVLVLRGGESDLLLADTVAQMQTRSPQTEVVEFGGVGHAPALMAQEQIDVVRDWLLRSK